MVTGGGGMLGRDVVRAAEAAGHDVTPLDRAALDVTDAAAARRAVAGARPDAVINCAAWTDVDGAEEAADEAMRVNGEAAGVVAAAAAEMGASVLLPSTDYVFDGAAPGVDPEWSDSRRPAPEVRPYVESDPTGPLSSYGRSKLAGEEATAAANPRHFVVRTSWLFGRGGRNFVEAMLGRAGGGEVRVVRDQVGSPTYTRHLADGLVRLAATEAHGVHHMAAAGHCSWHDFARAIFAEAGVECRVEATTTAALARPAPRPAWSVLDSERPGAIRLPGWREGLRAYLAERAAEVAA